MTRKIVSEMTYNVLNPTIPYHTLVSLLRRLINNRLIVHSRLVSNIVTELAVVGLPSDTYFETTTEKMLS